jgi:hypothetical protein
MTSLRFSIANRLNSQGKPDAGNLHVRFEEGDQRHLWSLLY